MHRPSVTIAHIRAQADTDALPPRENSTGYFYGGVRELVLGAAIQVKSVLGGRDRGRERREWERDGSGRAEGPCRRGGLVRERSACRPELLGHFVSEFSSYFCTTLSGRLWPKDTSALKILTTTSVRVTGAYVLPRSLAFYCGDELTWRQIVGQSHDMVWAK